jgi:hypothetical protein
MQALSSRMTTVKVQALFKGLGGSAKRSGTARSGSKPARFQGDALWIPNTDRPGKAKGGAGRSQESLGWANGCKAAGRCNQDVPPLQTGSMALCPATAASIPWASPAHQTSSR